MKIIEKHSHLNGLEFLLIQKPLLWKEIQEIVYEVDAERCKTKVSTENAKKGQIVYGSIDIDMAFNKLFEDKGWVESRIDYCKQMDFIKDRVAVKVQFSKYSFAAYDLFADHLAFYAGDKIDVGVGILPIEKFQTQMASGVAYYEGVLYDLIEQGRGVPAVPLVIIGVEP